VLRTSRDEGFISIGDEPGSCMCSTRQFWTVSDGAHWHETTTLPESFVKGGGQIYLWSANRIGVLTSAPRETSSSKFISSTLGSITDGTIVDVEPIPGGVAALVSSRVKGQGWDTAPRVLLVRGSNVQTITLPTYTGRPLVQSMDVDWPHITVNGTDFVANPVHAAVWLSPDGGATWSTG
jgi:hypothetical protein